MQPESRRQQGQRQSLVVSFMKYDLGFFDQELGTVTSAENPFEAKVLTMPPICKGCARSRPSASLIHQIRAPTKLQGNRALRAFAICGQPMKSLCTTLVTAR